MAGKRMQDRPDALRRAQALITEALDLLDAHGGAKPAAAHLVRALDELRLPPEEPQKN